LTVMYIQARSLRKKLVYTFDGKIPLAAEATLHREVWLMNACPCQPSRSLVNMESIRSYVLACLLACLTDAHSCAMCPRLQLSSSYCMWKRDPYLLPCRLTFIQAQLGPRLKLPSPPASRNISYLAQWPQTTHHPSASRILRGE
jgi:hypothetical protein